MFSLLQQFCKSPLSRILCRLFGCTRRIVVAGEFLEGNLELCRPISKISLQRCFLLRLRFGRVWTPPDGLLFAEKAAETLPLLESLHTACGLHSPLMGVEVLLLSLRLVVAAARTRTERSSAQSSDCGPGSAPIGGDLFGGLREISSRAQIPSGQVVSESRASESASADSDSRSDPHSLQRLQYPLAERVDVLVALGLVLLPLLF